MLHVQNAFSSTDKDPCEVENVSRLPMSEKTTTESVKDDCSTVMQDGEAQASVQANTETLWEPTVRLESPVPTNTSRPVGEDAQVQTDFTPLPAPPQQHTDQAAPSANAPGFESAGKKDTATLTEELVPNDLQHALSHTTETSACQDSTPCAPATTKSLYATDSEPKPKPSNELTRDYIPKVGMTTYTIVPQKSLEKLRYFEVALTLELPPDAPEQGLNIDSLQLDERTATREQTDVSKEQCVQHPQTPREELLTSTTTATAQGTVNGSISESIPSPTATILPKEDEKISSSANGSSPAGSPAEVKETKIPPATKPKPGSFRLGMPKKPPGYYVTSAAEKRPGAGSLSGHTGDQGSAERAKLPPPPLPPPGQWQYDTTEATNAKLSPQKDDKKEAIPRQRSPRSKEPSFGLSLDKLRSFTAPRPYSPSTPSRFAQAVSSAVKRSQSLSHGPKSPQSPVSTPASPITTSFAATESRELFKVSSDHRAFLHLHIRLKITSAKDVRSLELRHSALFPPFIQMAQLISLHAPH